MVDTTVWTHWQLAEHSLDRLADVVKTSIEAARDLSIAVIKHSIACAIALTILQNQEMFLNMFFANPGAITSLSSFTGSVHIIIGSKEPPMRKEYDIQSDFIQNFISDFPKDTLTFTEDSNWIFDQPEQDYTKWKSNVEKIFRISPAWTEKAMVKIFLLIYGLKLGYSTFLFRKTFLKKSRKSFNVFLTLESNSLLQNTQCHNSMVIRF